MRHKDFNKPLKKELIGFLKKEKIETIKDVWDRTKSYFSNKNIPVGGTVSTIGNYILVKGIYMGTRLNFTLNINEIK